MQGCLMTSFLQFFMTQFRHALMVVNLIIYKRFMITFFTENGLNNTQNLYKHIMINA